MNLGGRWLGHCSPSNCKRWMKSVCASSRGHKLSDGLHIQSRVSGNRKDSGTTTCAPAPTVDREGSAHTTTLQDVWYVCPVCTAHEPLTKASDVGVSSVDHKFHARSCSSDSTATNGTGVDWIDRYIWHTGRLSSKVKVKGLVPGSGFYCNS